MGSRSRNRGRHRTALLSFLVAVPLLGTVPAVAQEGSLCDVLDPGALEQLGEVRFAQQFGSPEYCVMEAAADQTGPHLISFYLSELGFGLTFDDLSTATLERSPASVHTEIGGHPAVVGREGTDGTNVLVGLEEHALTVFASIAGSAEAAGADEVAYAVSLAEVLAAALATSPLTDAAADPLAPPEVEGVSWRTVRVLSGAEIEGTIGEIERQIWDRLLEASGTGFEQAYMLDVNGFDAASDARLGNYLVLGVSGADATSLAPILVDWLAQLQGETFEAVGSALAGRDVTRILVDGESQGYIYATGDRLHLVAMPAEAAERVIAALP